MKKAVISQTPYRLALTGGHDQIPYVQRYGGSGFAVAINKYATIIIGQRLDKKIELTYPGKYELAEKLEDVIHPIIQAVLQKYGLDGVSIYSHSDIPPGSGLGSSGTFTVGLLNAVHAYLGETLSPADLAEEAADIEINALKSPIGKYDQYAAALGGFLNMEFQKDGSVIAKEVKIPAKAKAEFARNTFLVYSGIRRDAGVSLGVTLAGLLAGDQPTFDRITAFRNHAEQMRRLMEQGAVADFARSLPRLMELKTAAHPASSIPAVKKMIDTGIKLGALGAKNMGAGRGGFIYYYVPEEHHQDFIDGIQKVGGTLFPFSVVNHGTRILT